MSSLPCRREAAVTGRSAVPEACDLLYQLHQSARHLSRRPQNRSTGSTGLFGTEDFHHRHAATIPGDLLTLRDVTSNAVLCARSHGWRVCTVEVPGIRQAPSLVKLPLDEVLTARNSWAAERAFTGAT
jgi:hypothetical protein